MAWVSVVSVPISSTYSTSGPKGDGAYGDGSDAVPPGQAFTDEYYDITAAGFSGKGLCDDWDSPAESYEATPMECTDSLAINCLYACNGGGWSVEKAQLCLWKVFDVLVPDQPPQAPAGTKAVLLGGGKQRMVILGEFAVPPPPEEPGDGTECNPCISQCTLECRNECEDGCSGECNEECNNACQGICAECCTLYCASGCAQYCTLCTGGCDMTCGVCSGNCSHQCGGNDDNHPLKNAANCMLFCTHACKEACVDISCNTFCRSDCGQCSNLCYSCTGMCIAVCAVRCEITCSHCSDQCQWWCDLTCNRDCFADCRDRCLLTCIGHCTTFLKSDTTANVTEHMDQILNTHPTSEGYIHADPQNREEQRDSFFKWRKDSL